MIRGLIVAMAAAVALGGAARAEPAPAAGKAAATAHDDAVALLPLDAERSLEIYGQPVASELARALAAGNVSVVVVGPRMAVPERARLIVDGKITIDRAGAVTISLRLRNTLDGTTLETLTANASGLAKIDSAAAELAIEIVPLVRDRLAEIHRGGEPRRARPAVPGAPAAPSDRQLSASRTVLIIASDTSKPKPGGRPSGAQLLPVLDSAIAMWVAAHHRQPGVLAAPLTAAGAKAAVAQGGGELAISFQILDYTADQALADPALPIGRARVRVQLADRSGVIFDRVVATDSVLGEHGLAPDALAARVAREVLAILAPHMRRSVPAW